MNPIDHVEVMVPDRWAAAAWYREVLDLRVVEGFESWSDDPRGPLMISGDGGATKLALFQGGEGDRLGTGGFHQLAFRVDGSRFIEFLDRVEAAGLTNRQGESVTRRGVSDHTRAFSVYFCDPWGHRLEVTTYDHELVRARLAGP